MEDQKNIKLQGERESRKGINILGIFEQFPENSRGYLLEGMQHIQVTDGCTGGCAWCGLDVIRKVRQGFTIESWSEFAAKYASGLPELTSLYWASDPMDISGYRESGIKYNYVDFLDAIIPHLSTNQRIYTSTVVPRGTERVALDTVMYLHDVWDSNWQRDADGRIHPIRFSVTDNNRAIIDAILEQSGRLGANPSYIDAIRDLCEGRGKEIIKKIGNFINHKERTIMSQDSVPIASYDGTLLTPEGLYTVSTTLVTRLNPYGYFKDFLDPYTDAITIPRYSRLTDFMGQSLAHTIRSGTRSVGDGMILPRLIVDQIDPWTGEILTTDEIPSVGRDALAMRLLYGALTELYTTSELTAIMRESLIAVQEEIDNRYEGCQSLITSNPEGQDSEAVEVLNTSYQNASIIIDLLLG